jgi:predicted regulator of Ras-like GTPase activity (Roadblock/LC7/MglB family)
VVLEPILLSLREVKGVQGAMIVDETASVIAHHAHSIYDLAVLQQVARSIINSTDSAQLIYDDWEVIAAHFDDGKLLLRGLKTSGPKPRRYFLAVIADGTLNLAFLGVALRVAASKLVSVLDTISAPGAPAAPAAPTASGSRAGVATPSHGTSRIPRVDLPPPEPRSRRFTWPGSHVEVDGFGVDVADAASSAFLSGCTTALATNVGPIAKVFVRDAVRKICVDRPFSRADGPALLAHLAAEIDDVAERATFQRATRGL